MSQPPVKSDDYELPDDSCKKILTQIDDEERLWSLFTDMKEFVEYATIPILESLNVEKLSEFLTPMRVRLF